MRKISENAAAVLKYLQKDGNKSDLTRGDIAEALGMDEKAVGGYLLQLYTKTQNVKDEDGKSIRDEDGKFVREVVDEALVCSVDGVRTKTVINKEGEEVEKDAKVKFIKLTDYGMSFNADANIK